MIKSKIYNLAHSGITCPGSYLLLLSHFSCVWLCVTPFLGSSRQEHWSGLPFPSPMHKSEKWKWSCSVMSNSSRPHGLQPTRLLRSWDFPGKSTGVGCHCLLWVPTYLPSNHSTLGSKFSHHICLLSFFPHPSPPPMFSLYFENAKPLHTSFILVFTKFSLNITFLVKLPSTPLYHRLWVIRQISYVIIYLMNAISSRLWAPYRGLISFVCDYISLPRSGSDWSDAQQMFSIRDGYSEKHQLRQEDYEITLKM